MKSIKKLCLALLACLCASVTVFGLASCQPTINIESTNSNSKSFVENSESVEEEGIYADEGDLADSEYVSSKVLKDYMVIANLSLQESSVSKNSTSALKGTFNKKDGETYEENKDKIVSTSVLFDLERYYNGLQDLQNKSFVFDVKIANTYSFASVSVMGKDEKRQAEHSFDCRINNVQNTAGITKTSVNEEWAHVAVELDVLFPANVLAKTKYVILVFNNKECNEDIDSVFYLDNVSVEDSQHFDDGKADEGDLADIEYASTKIINNYVVHSTLSLQSSIVSEDSSSAIRGVFNYRSGEAYTENGANKIWTAVCFDLKEYYGAYQDLRNATASFDVKVKNSSHNAAVSIMGKNGVKQTEYSFSCKTDSTSVMNGLNKTIVNDDWTRIKVDLGFLYPADVLEEAQYLILVFSNVDCDEDISSVFYIDNVKIEDANPVSGTVSADEGDLASVDYAYTKIIDNWVTHSRLSLQSETISQNSTSAIKGIFNYKMGTPYPGYGRNDIWTVLAFDLEMYYGDCQDLRNATVYFDLSIQNCDSQFEFGVMKSDEVKQTQHALNVSSSNTSTPAGVTKTILSSLWTRFTVDLSAFYGDDLLAETKYFLLIFDNNYSDQEINSIFYVDNVKIEFEGDSKDTGDMANIDYVSTQIINNWVVHSDLSLQSDTVSENSTSSIRGSFNCQGADCYTDKGGNWVWTAVCFDLKAYYGSSQNLQGKAVTFDIKTTNCSPTSSLSVVNASGSRTAEVSFDNRTDNTEGKTGLFKQILNSEWVRLTVYFDLLFENAFLSQADTFIIVFSNAYSNEDIDSVFHIDNVYVQDGNLTWYQESYNPEGYYSKTEFLEIQIVGNSFIYYSDTAAWLQKIADSNGANISASFTWTPNGRIPNQYENAFGAGGYMNGNYRPDLIYIQDFYDFNDALHLNTFAQKLMEISPETELKVYPGENETTDGLAAADNMSLDVINWRGLIKDLKAQGFTSINLNDARDGWHPNQLSGVIGAILIYMDLYGEIPNIDVLWDDLHTTVDWYDTYVYTYLPGTTDNQKREYLSLIFDLATAYAGL